MHAHVTTEHEYYISRVSDHNGVSPLYLMLEIHHSGREPSNREMLSRGTKAQLPLSFCRFFFDDMHS